MLHTLQEQSSKIIYINQLSIIYYIELLLPGDSLNQTCWSKSYSAKQAGLFHMLPIAAPEIHGYEPGAAAETSLANYLCNKQGRSRGN